MAGLEKGSGTQSSLVWESLRIIEYHKPKYLLMENVKNLVSDKFMPYFKMICEELEKFGYNNYWSVLNGKDFDVPQNRERVMMLSIRKDVDKGVFCMPIGVPTTKRLKDVLDDEVEDKYCIPKPKMDKFIPNDNFKTLYNNDGQRPTQIGFIQKGEDGVQHQSNTVYDGNCVSCTLCAGDWKSPKIFMVENDEPKIITERIVRKVKVRKYEVDIEGLKTTLKQAKSNVGLTIKQITEKLNVTKTTVEHWFRNDECFSVPSEDIWLELKELLKIETDEFDKSIMEWEIKDNEYDISNRVYNVEGICPTLTTAGENGTKTIKDDYKIRKLTPKECWRLMGFTDEDFFKAKDLGGLSNTKLYERAGRGIVVPMLEEIFRNMIKNEEE
jgi:DNA (cytosine-5)-methyltransferase 1